MDFLIEFESIKKIACEFRLAGKNGLTLWNTIKYNYSEEPLTKYKWKHIDEDFDKYIMMLPEHNDGIMNEPFHFIIQCVRIQKKNPILNKRRLMQIALNIGQLIASESDIPKDIMKNFYILHMEKLFTYIDDK